MNEIYRTARAYSEAGLCCIPLEGKRPTIPWKNYQHCRPDNSKLGEWFEENGKCNLGIVTGCVSGDLLVIDWDDRHAYGGWAEENPGLADTAQVETANGGRHLYYRLQDGGPGLTTQPFAWKGKHAGEIRFNGGQVVAPPSVGSNGKKYRWLTVHDKPMRAIPSWDVLGLHLKKRAPPTEIGKRTADSDGLSAYAKPALEREIGKLTMTRVGERNNQLNAAAFGLGQLVGAGLLDQTEVEQALTTTTLSIGLGQRETEATIRSGLEAGMAEPRNLPDNWERPRPQQLGERLDKGTAELIAQAAPPCPDPELQQWITNALEGKEGTKAHKRKIAGGRMLAWLQEQGRFIRSSTDGRICYFYSPERRLLNLETNLWRAWLYALTGANPAGADFAHLFADCMTSAQLGEEREVVQLAAWDRDTATLRVSKFDGTVYVLDGETITEEDNCEHVLFDDLSWWTPYKPNLEQTSDRALRWSTQDVTCFHGNAQTHALGYRAWMLATFFTELCPTRPLLVFLGEKGSGKTMTLRIFLQLLFGPAAQVSGVPDRPDGFTAAASANPVLVLDNLDQFTPWLRDKLARLSSGAVDQYRRLYTSNEVGTVRYRTWLAFTARTPDTLRRDDLADRLVLLPTSPIPDNMRQPERHFLNVLRVVRDDWWGDVLLALNGVVASVRRGELATTSELRMADWESLGRLVARNEGNEDLWDEFVQDLKLQQSGFLLSDDLLVEGLEEWTKNPSNHGREVKSRELHADLSRILFDDKHLPKDWPQSTSGFGKKLAGVRHSLRTLYRVEWRQERNYWIYQFWPLEG